MTLQQSLEDVLWQASGMLVEGYIRKISAREEGSPLPRNLRRKLKKMSNDKRK